jgi:hypothetical protein
MAEEYKQADALREGDVWIDPGDHEPWTLRVVETGEHPIPSAVIVIGEDIATGDRYAFEFDRDRLVLLGEAPDD